LTITRRKKVNGAPGEGPAAPLTFDYYQELALGQLSWTPATFYEATPRELENALKGFFNLYEVGQQQSWERERWSTTVLVNLQLPKNKKVKATDLVRFPWENKHKAAKLTKKEAKAILSKWQKGQ